MDGMGDVFAEMFARQAQARRNARGNDVQYRLTVSFLDAINGATPTHNNCRSIMSRERALDRLFKIGRFIRTGKCWYQLRQVENSFNLR